MVGDRVVLQGDEDPVAAHHMAGRPSACDAKRFWATRTCRRGGRARGRYAGFFQGQRGRHTPPGTMTTVDDRDEVPVAHEELRGGGKAWSGTESPPSSAVERWRRRPGAPSSSVRENRPCQVGKEAVEGRGSLVHRALTPQEKYWNPPSAFPLRYSRVRSNAVLGRTPWR